MWSKQTADRRGSAQGDERSNRSIMLGGRLFPVRITRHARARAIRLRYDAVRQEVRVSVPPAVGFAMAHGVLLKHRDWLEAEVARAIAPVRLLPGTEIAIDGEPRRIDWRATNARRPMLRDSVVRIGGPAEGVERRLLAWLKEEARRRFAADLFDYCARAGEPVPKLGVGDARTRWGSCSPSGIRLNWRLVMAPATVRRSVVAHEVAHLRHMDHSTRFYAHLDRLFEGDRKAADHWLKMHGAGLRAIAAD